MSWGTFELDPQTHLAYKEFWSTHIPNAGLRPQPKKCARPVAPEDGTGVFCEVYPVEFVYEAPKEHSSGRAVLNASRHPIIRR